MTLSDADERLIAEARELATLGSASAVRQHFGTSSGSGTDTTAGYVEAFGRAQYLLTKLAALAERGSAGADQARKTIPACPRCGATELEVVRAGAGDPGVREHADAWRCDVCGQQWETGLQYSDSSSPRPPPAT